MLASCEMSRAYTPPDAPITYSSGSSMDVPSDPVTWKHCCHMPGEIGAGLPKASLKNCRCDNLITKKYAVSELSNRSVSYPHHFICVSLQK